MGLHVETLKRCLEGRDLWETRAAFTCAQQTLPDSRDGAGRNTEDPRLLNPGGVCV